MEYENLLRKYRKKPIARMDDLTNKPTFYQLNYDKSDIMRLIPHRDPFLLIDRLIGLDLEKDNETLWGIRNIEATDPIFKGHFPGYPVYPGALQIEMTGQLGLCLSYFVVNQTYKIAPDVKMMHLRATRVLGALFVEELVPDQQAIVIARKLDYDGYFGKVLGQVLVDRKVCSVGIAEVIFLDQD